MSDRHHAFAPVAAGDPLAARAARLAKFKREQLIVAFLNRGVSVVEIAARVGIGEKRMRAIIREILARRMPGPPEEFVAIQVSRLNEALLVAFSAMSGANLRAVDRVIKIVRELDRYGGAFAAEWRRPETSRLDAPAKGAAMFRAALTCNAQLALQDDEATALDLAGDGRPENLPQNLEKVESAPGVASALRAGASSEVGLADLILRLSKDAPLGADVAARWSMVRDATPCAATPHDGREFLPTVPVSVDRPEIPTQTIEKIESAPGTATAPESKDPLAASQVEAAPDLTLSLPKDAPLTANIAGNWMLRDAPLRVAPVRKDEGVPSVAHAGDDRPDNSSQDLEKIESAPGYFRPPEGASGSGSPSVVTPWIPLPLAMRRVRMTLNGVAPC